MIFNNFEYLWFLTYQSKSSFLKIEMNDEKRILLNLSTIFIFAITFVCINVYVFLNLVILEILTILEINTGFKQTYIITINVYYNVYYVTQTCLDFLTFELFLKNIF